MSAALHAMPRAPRQPRHWAADLVGRPYTAERNCWALVREACGLHFGIEFPPIEVGASDNLRAIKQAVRDSGMRRVQGRPRHGDLVVLRSVARTHVGLALNVNGALHLLHATSAAGVLCERWADAASGMRAEIWRCSPGQLGDEPDWSELPQDRETFRGVLQVVATVALAYFFPVGTGANFSWTNAAINVLGNVAAGAAINKLLPLKADGLATQPEAGTVYSTSLQGNESRLDQPIWKVCGRREITPPFACQPYFEYEPKPGEADPNLDNEQYFYALYAVGIGDHTIHGAKIGNTPVSRFADVLVAQYLPPGTAPSAVNANVCTVTEVAGVVLEYGVVSTAFPACAPGRTVTKFAVDMVCPRGLGKGTDELSVNWRMQYRQIDDYGRPLASWVIAGSAESRTAATATPQRYTVERTLPSAMRVEVRIIRTNTEDTEPGALNQLAWASLRAYLAEPAPLDPNTAHYELVLRASSQLSDLSSRQLRLIATAHAESLDEDLERVAAAATRNPAWWLLDLATSETWGVGKPDSRVDLQSFYDLAQTCAERQDRFDYVFDSAINAWDAMQLIARSCRARVFRRNGVISVARDEWTPVPVTLFSHRNSKPGMLLDETLRTRESPDGVIAEYQDHRTWEWTAIDCPSPGVSEMTNPVRIRYDGIVGAKHAEREGLYDAAAMLYRTRTVLLTTELQGVLPAYMSPVEVLPDVAGYGSSGDVVDWDTDTLTATLSEPPDWEAAPLYMRLMRDDGTLTDEALVTPGATANEVVLPAAPDFELVVDDGTRERPKYVIGAKELAKVLSIEDGGKEDGGAQLYNLSCVIDDERVHTADVHLLPGPGDVQDPVGSPDDTGGDYGGDTDPYIPPPLTVNLIGIPNVYGVDLLAGTTLVYSVHINGIAQYTAGNADPVQLTGSWLLDAPVEPLDAADFEVRFDFVSASDGDGSLSVTSDAALSTWLPMSSDHHVAVAFAYIDNGVPAVIDVSVRIAATEEVQETLRLYFRYYPDGGVPA